MRIRELTSGFFRSFQRHSITVVLSLVVLSGLYGLFGLGALAAFNTRDLLSRWGNQVEITVYLSEGVSQSATENVQAQIKSLPHVATAQLISKEQAKLQFSEHLQSYAPDLARDPEFENIFPASIVTKLDGSNGRDEIEQIAKTIRSFPEVAEVNYGQEWISNFKNFAGALQKIGFILFVLFGLSGLFIIGNLQRMTIAERTEEIEIMELIGATAARIRTPFLFDGALLGLLASIVGLSFCSFLFYLQSKIVTQDLPFLDVLGQFRFFNFAESATFCAFGTGLGWIGSWFATRHIRDSWFASKRKQST
jgi:cell division transport system permease protein